MKLYLLSSATALAALATEGGKTTRNDNGTYRPTWSQPGVRFAATFSSESGLYGAAWQFSRGLSADQARRLFYVSLVYLPVVLVLLALDKIGF